MEMTTSPSALAGATSASIDAGVSPEATAGAVVAAGLAALSAGFAGASVFAAGSAAFGALVGVRASGAAQAASSVAPPPSVNPTRNFRRFIKAAPCGAVPELEQNGLWAPG